MPILVGNGGRRAFFLYQIEQYSSDELSLSPPLSYQVFFSMLLERTETISELLREEMVSSNAKIMVRKGEWAQGEGEFSIFHLIEMFRLT